MSPMCDLVLASTSNKVTTLTMNDPRRLNGWTLDMMNALADAFARAAEDAATAVVVLTGTDPYYSAGVNLSSTIRLGHPRTLRDAIVRENQALFDRFIDFPKPLVAAVNGPAIGATVTSATLCDAILASETATFSTPFARLAVPPEGCSSVHLPKLIGSTNANRMLGKEGWRPTAVEALEVQLVNEVVPHRELLPRAQALGEAWASEARARTFRAGSTREELKAANARESEALGDAFLAAPFLMGQYRFLWSRKKYSSALTFLGLRLTRPAWSLML
ncbi:MAG: enoyl-CoA hydratase/isomerase family protein [Myxococcota bacterium]